MVISIFSTYVFPNRDAVSKMFFDTRPGYFRGPERAHGLARVPPISMFESCIKNTMPEMETTGKITNGPASLGACTAYHSVCRF